MVLIGFMRWFYMKWKLRQRDDFCGTTREHLRQSVRKTNLDKLLSTIQLYKSSSSSLEEMHTFLGPDSHL